MFGTGLAVKARPAPGAKVSAPGAADMPGACGVGRISTVGEGVTGPEFSSGVLSIIENMFDYLAESAPFGDESALVESIAALERIKAAAAARQARLTAALDHTRRCADAAAGVPAARRGRGVAAEVALARRDSPARGSRHLGFAKALVHEMPHTLAALEKGAVSEWRATLVVRESACLDVEDRRRLDAELCSDSRGLDGMGDAAVAAAARAIAYRLDPHAVVERAVRAHEDRTVTIRPAPDTMAYLTALLPVAQGVSVYAALKREADRCRDRRSRGQAMADVLVERVTGRPAAQPVPVAVNLVISDQALLGVEHAAAVIAGYGSVPSAVAQSLIADAVSDPASLATLRRLYATAASGALVAMDSRSRLFPKGLAEFIGLRDQRCRTPYCNAPIRHRDHARPHRRGGRTSSENGLGMCAGCNLTKESPGWTVGAGSGENGRHTAQFTTPTGAHHHSLAPPAPGTPRTPMSDIEVWLNNRLLPDVSLTG